MKNSNSAVAEAKKSNRKKTALDNFQLFYEEVPLELDKHSQRTDGRPKDRLARRSRTK